MINKFYKENQNCDNDCNINTPILWLATSIVLPELFCLLKYVSKLYISNDHIKFVICLFFFQEVLLKCLGEINNC